MSPTERARCATSSEHNLLGAPITETSFEPHVGGHIYDRFIAETPERTRVELEHAEVLDKAA